MFEEIFLTEELWGMEVFYDLHVSGVESHFYRNRYNKIKWITLKK